MRLAIFAALVLGAGTALGHDGVVHSTPEEAAKHRADQAELPDLAAPQSLPFELGGAFELTDQYGQRRGQTDPDGHLQLLFFGYANCPSICAVAMPLMAEVTDIMAARGHMLRPVMITVDPQRDTVSAMGAPLAALHSDFVGLTGSDAELAAVYDLFQVEHEQVFTDPEYGPVYAHGSHIYLLSSTGEVLTFLPPILSADRVAQIVENYAGAGS